MRGCAQAGGADSGGNGSLRVTVGILDFGSDCRAENHGSVVRSVVGLGRSGAILARRWMPSHLVFWNEEAEIRKDEVMVDHAIDVKDPAGLPDGGGNCRSTRRKACGRYWDQGGLSQGYCGSNRAQAGGARAQPEPRGMVRSVVEPADYGHDRLRIGLGGG